MSKRPSMALLILLAVAAVVVGCSGDNPTQPTQANAPTSSGGGGGSSVWNISVTASSNQIAADSDSAITITINVTRASDGTKPANGTTVVVSTNLGDFDTQGSGLQTGTLSLFDGTARVNFFPGSNPGTARVFAQLESSRGSTSITISELLEFFLNAITPNIGNPGGGEVVVISGGGFIEPVRVTFDGNAAPVESVNASRIRVRTPSIALQAGSTRSVTVAVTNNFNGPEQASDQLVNAFTYTFGGSAGEPRIFSVTPGSGPNEGGTTVVIIGENFESPVQVMFGSGGTPASFNGTEATVQSVTPTRIVVTAPSATDFGQGLLNQRVDILVRNVNTGLATISSDAFQYGPNVLVTEINPNSGPASGNQLVTVFGQGFVEPLQVRMGSVVDPQPLVSVLPNEIVVRTTGVETNSCGNVSGPVIVTLLDTGNENSQGPTYVYQVPGDGPQISGLNPTRGGAAGGTNVTINGSNFYNNMRVTFGDRPGSISSSGGGTMTVQTPFLPDSAFQTQSCDDDGDGTQGERFVETAVDLVVTNLSTTCEATFPDAFVYTPPTTVCMNDAGAVNPPTASFTSTVINAATNTVQFNDTSTGNPATWAWDFENDGIVDATAQFPQFSYPAPGTYAVSLRVSNSAGTDTTVQSITVP